MMPGHEQQQNASVVDIINATADIRILFLETEEDFSWQAGQYINISFAGLPARPYSIAGAPGGRLEIHIKRGAGPASNHVMDKLQTGERITLSGPEGRSIYEQGRQKPILAIAGGLGIAPLKAIAEQALREQAQAGRPFTLYWGTRDENERYMDEYFHDLAQKHSHFTFHPVSGVPVIDKAAADCDDLAARHIFLSGPPAMIGAAIPLLTGKGARRDQISYDFHPEAAAVTPS